MLNKIAPMVTWTWLHNIVVNKVTQYDDFLNVLVQCLNGTEITCSLRSTRVEWVEKIGLKIDELSTELSQNY